MQAAHDRGTYRRGLRLDLHNDRSVQAQRTATRANVDALIGAGRGHLAHEPQRRQHLGHQMGQLVLTEILHDPRSHTVPDRIQRRDLRRISHRHGRRRRRRARNRRDADARVCATRRDRLQPGRRVVPGRAEHRHRAIHHRQQIVLQHRTRHRLRLPVDSQEVASITGRG